MRARVAVIVFLAVCAGIVPAHAQVPLLRCTWSGVLRVDSDFSFETMLWSLGSGSGRCIGDGKGPHVATFTSAEGSEAVGLFGLSVRYKLWSTSTGLVRRFTQDWSGLYFDCSIARFRIAKPSNLPVGTGNIKYCGPLWPNVPPQPLDVPVMLTWSFVPIL